MGGGTGHLPTSQEGGGGTKLGGISNPPVIVIIVMAALLPLGLLTPCLLTQRRHSNGSDGSDGLDGLDRSDGMPVEQTMIESKVLLQEQDDVPSEERNRSLWRAKMDYQFLCCVYEYLF